MDTDGLRTDGYRLGIDLGTSNTAAVVREADGRTRPLLFDGAPLLPSAVCLDPAGHLLVGRDAVHAARAYPDRFEPNPKQRADEGTVLLGDSVVPVEALFAAILERVVAEAVHTMGAPPREVRLTHPAAWGAGRRGVLLAAAARAGLDQPRLVSEPVAAATYFVEVVHALLPVGSCLVVYDFGAGTFDASVVRRTADGFDVLAADGLPDAGGLDIDAALLAHLGAVYGARYADWHRLEEPTDTGARRANRLLWDDVRTAKEVLSRAPSTFVHIPLIEQDAPLGREQLERLARPIVDRTIGATRSAIRGADLTPSGVSAVFLVGGSSRLPLAATLLHRAFGIAPTAIEQPELVVAEGSVCDNGGVAPAVGRARPVSPAAVAVEPAPAVAAEPVPAAAAVRAPTTPEAESTPPPPPKPGRLGLIAIALAALAFLVWMIADSAVWGYTTFGLTTARHSVAVLFVPAHAAWFAGKVLAHPGRRLDVLPRAVVHALAVAVGFVGTVAVLRPLFDGFAGARAVAVLAAMGVGIWLAVRTGTRAESPQAPDRPRRWLWLGLAFGAAVGIALSLGGGGVAWYDSENMAERVVDDPSAVVYYLPYAVGVGLLVAVSLALGAGLAWLVRRRATARTLGIATGSLLATGAVALEAWQSGTFG